MTNNNATTSKYPATFDYYFLYSKPFFGLEPPLPFLVCCVGVSLFYLFCVYVLWPAIRPRTKASILRAATLRYWHNIAL